MLTTFTLVFLLLLALLFYRQSMLNRTYKKTQLELKASEKKYRELIETASVVAWELDLSTQRFSYMSPQIGVLTGFAPELWTDFEYWAARVHQDDRDWVSNYCKLETQKGNNYSFDYRLITLDDKTIWLRDVITVIKDKGRPVALRGYIIENTEYKRAELLQQEKARWLFHVMDTLPNGIQECDVKGKITYSNIAHHQILGVPEGELPGHYVWDFLTDDRQKKELGDYLKFLVRKQPVPETFQVMNRTVDGRQVELEYKWDYRRNEHGDVVGFVSVISDITERKLIQDKLRKSENNLTYAQKIAHVGSWEFELSDNTLSWSSEAFRILELDPEKHKACYEMFINAVHPDDRERVNRIYTDAATRETVFEINHRLLMKDGRIKYVLERSETLFDKNGKALRSMGIVTDVTEYIEGELALRNSEERFQDFAETAADLFWEMDENLRFSFVSGQIDSLMGYETVQVIGMNRQELYAEQGLVETPEFKNHLKLLEAHLPFTNFEVLWKTPDEEIRHIKVSGKPLFNERGDFTGYRGVSQDITESKLAEEKILQQAHFDSLTNLPNRFLSLDRLTQLLTEAKRSAEKVAVLFLDMDDFKKVNDSLGHETGDKLLIEAAERLIHVVREGDTVGRLGGDEFIVLLGALENASDVRPIAENLLHRFRDAFKIDGRDLMLTASVGIAVYPDDGDNASELLRNADSAMYHSKELGRNTYSYFTEEMNRDVIRRLALEEQIHGALERGEFSVYYQPQIEISDSRIMGAEALLRWFNPALGQVSPVEFIPVAEQTGLIVPLGQFVLQQALAKTELWQKQFDSSFRIAVNLSPRQFRDPGLVNSIQLALQQTSVKSQTLELEITEGVLMSGHSYIDDALEMLSKMNVNLAMDDFGTGYSSLSYLRRYPFDVLKIDRSFIRDITENSADRELINAAIAMAHGLNLKVVAEGVETTDQLAYLKSLNCDYAQGYLFGKPMTDTELSSLLTKETAENFVN